MNDIGCLAPLYRDSMINCFFFNHGKSDSHMLYRHGEESAHLVVPPFGLVA